MPTPVTLSRLCFELWWWLAEEAGLSDEASAKQERGLRAQRHFLNNDTSSLAYSFCSLRALSSHKPLINGHRERHFTSDEIDCT